MDKGGLRRRIGWGIPESKPVWWPEDVPWTKKGVQSGMDRSQLTSVILAAYNHHCQQLDPVSIF